MAQRQHIVIHTGGDPRDLPEFAAIRQEIDKINHPAQPEVNWLLIESLALTLFRRNGVDLQTVAYYIFARARLAGLAGFTEGCELLAGVVTAQWENCWPDNETARIETLDWFTARSGNILRALSFSEKDLRLLYRAERALQLISDKLQQVPLRRVPKVENLLIFVQNTGRRIEQEKQQGKQAARRSPTETLLWMSGKDKQSVVSTLVPTPEIIAAEPEPTSAAPRVKEQGVKPPPAFRWRCQGFLAGILCSLATAACAGYFYVMPLQQQAARLAEQPLGASLLWLTRPKAETYGEQLNRIMTLQPFSPLDLGARSVATAQRLWPQAKLQQTETARWQNRLRLASETPVADGGYTEVRQRLEKLHNELLEQERVRGGLTISYLKTAIYQMQSAMATESPLETLLIQLDAAVHQQKTAPAGLVKQINERWEILAARYYQLMQPGAEEQE